VTRNLFFSGRQKDLLDFVSVLPMSDVDLGEIYKLRLAHFHDGAPVFDEDAANFLVANANGLVGMFLRYCFEIYRAHHQTLPITFDMVQGHLRRQLQEWRNSSDALPLVNKAVQAIRARELEIETDLDPAGAGLLHRLLYYVPGQRTRYAISGLYAGLLAELAARG
jgi:hypothetical protein